MDMDRFVSDQNLERLRKLANVSTTEAERKILFGLLAEVKTDFIELQKARIPVLIQTEALPHSRHRARSNATRCRKRGGGCLRIRRNKEITHPQTML